MIKKSLPEAKEGKNTNYLIAFFQAVLRFCYTYPKIIIVLFIGLFLLCVYGFKHIHLELDIYDVKSNNFISSTNWFKLRDEFKDPNSLYFVWKPSNILDSKAHCQWQQEIQKIRNKEEGITRVFQVYSAREPNDHNGDLLYERKLQDPCLSAMTQASLDSVRNSYLGPVLLDQKTSSFLTEISFEGNTEKNETIPIEDIERISKELIAKNKSIDPKGEIHYLGPLSYRLEFKKMMAQDGYLHIGLFLFIILFFRFFLGTWSSGLIYAASTLMTIVYTVGFMAFMGYPIDILTNNLILMTAIAGTADFLFLSFEFFKFDAKRSYYNMVTAAFFTTFTTMVGFLSLYSSDLEMIRRFGFAAATGAFFEWAVLFTLVPAIMEVCKINRVWVNPDKAIKIEHFKKILNFTPPKFIVYLFLFVSAMALVSWPFFNYSDSPKNNFPINHSLRSAIDGFKKDFNWEGNISLLFYKNVSIDEMSIIQNKIKAHPLVLFLENKKELLDSWTNKFSGQSRKDLIVRDFESTSINQRFESPDYRRSIIYLKNVNTIELEKFQKITQELCQDKCFLSGQTLVYLELNKRVSYTMIESFVVSILLVLIIIFSLMRTLKVAGAKFIHVGVSSLIAPLFMMTVIAVIQVPVNVVTSIFFAALVGLTGDNAIQYLFASYGHTIQHGMKLRGDASLVFSLLLIFGSLFFIGQTLVPLKWLGILFSVGFLITFIGDYWILKGLNDES